MNGLPEFLRARLDEDRQAVDDWHWHDCPTVGDERKADEPPPCGCPLPRRALAEVDAKRRIVDWLAEDAAFDMPAAKAQAASREEWYLVTLARTTLKLLALPYVDHPDYRGDWQP